MPLCEAISVKRVERLADRADRQAQIHRESMRRVIRATTIPQQPNDLRPRTHSLTPGTSSILDT